MAGTTNKKSVGVYWKAIIAFGVPFVGLLSVVASDPTIREAAPGPTAWLVAVGIPVLTGVIAFFKRNQQTADQIDAALEKGEITLADLQKLLEKWQQDR